MTLPKSFCVLFAILLSIMVMLYVEIVCFVHEYFWGTKNGVEADGNCGALHRKPVRLTTRISFRPTSFRHKISLNFGPPKIYVQFR